MLTISPIPQTKYNFYQQTEKNNSVEPKSLQNFSIKTNQIYPNFYNINFKSRIVYDIEHDEYINMSEEEKNRIREKYENFFKLVNFDDLHKKTGRTTDSTMPLYNPATLNDFLKTSSEYNKYRDHKIICVGRSPKWFLNASIWMKNGIEDYDFVAFSTNWYERNNYGLGLKQTFHPERYPKEEEKEAYKKYLKSLKCSPKDIIEAAKDGKKVIITDYIHSGCGLASFLDILSKIAEEDGVLDDFAKSIKLYTLSSMDYFDELGYTMYSYYPIVILPDRLKPYKIEQEYHDMNANVMREMLINKNTNECRSTYYPPAAWTIYNPKDFKTGFIQDVDLKNVPQIMKKTHIRFTDGMKDFRNLMNFRILDGLNKANLLKLKHITR